MTGALVHINNKAAWEAALKSAKASNKACIVDFFAEWCGPCKAIAPEYEKLAAATPGLVFLKVDVDEAAEVAELCDVTSMPTFQIWVDEKPVKDATLVGASKDKLRDLVARFATLPAA